MNEKRKIFIVKGRALIIMIFRYIDVTSKTLQVTHIVATLYARTVQMEDDNQCSASLTITPTELLSQSSVTSNISPYTCYIRKTENPLI